MNKYVPIARAPLSALFTSLALCASMAGCQSALKAPRTDDSGTLSYGVEVDAEMNSLNVVADFPPGTPVGWGVDRSALPFVSALQIKPHGSSVEYDWSDTGEEACKARGCALTYRFALKRAAEELDSRMVAAYFGESIVAPPSTWLVRPKQPAPKSRQRYRVKTQGAIRFGTGTTPVQGEKGVYESPTALGFHTPYAAFGPMREQLIPVGEDLLSVFLLSPVKQKREDEYLQWIAQSGEAVAQYYGRFPAEHTAVFLSPLDYHGSQMGIGGASVILGMNSNRSPEKSGRAWVAVHEMIHVGFPGTNRKHQWATEGVATYVESVARVQAKQISLDAFWSELMNRLPEGQPQVRDRGLDQTRTWARTYWGGALFWFAGDVEIGRATNGARSLRDGLRGLVDKGGNSAVFWPLERTLSTMDEATETTVLSHLYRVHARAPIPIRLDDLFEELGVSRVDGRIMFNEQAPLAHVRRTIDGSK